MYAIRSILMVGLTTVLVGVCPARAERVKLDVALSHPVLLAGKKQTAYLKVGLTGVPLANPEHRAPANIAIVLDRSGSMSGEKIRKAKEAAILAIARLGSEDIVSVVAYNSYVTVLVPATKVSDKHALYSAINRLYAGGSTALFAGVSKGAHEVRKFIAPDRVNRVILLSDGLANVGPSSPEALAALGASLAKEGISVTTIGLGLGYNEDLMFHLAHASDGAGSTHMEAFDGQRAATGLNACNGIALLLQSHPVCGDRRCIIGIHPGGLSDLLSGHPRDLLDLLRRVILDELPKVFEADGPFLDKILVV